MAKLNDFGYVDNAVANIRRVVEELKRKMEQTIRQNLTGRIDKNNESAIASARNLDMKKK